MNQLEIWSVRWGEHVMLALVFFFVLVSLLSGFHNKKRVLDHSFVLRPPPHPGSHSRARFL